MRKTGTNAVQKPNSRKALTEAVGESISHPPSAQSSLGPPKIREAESGLEISASFAATAQTTFGTSDVDLRNELLLQVTRASPASLVDPHGNHALAALYGISPRDTLEGMLSTQMVAGHNLAMEFLSRATAASQPEVVERNVNLATKLERTFLAQVEALDRHRGKGEVRMNVEQVHIHDGAQGIVGPVSHQGSLEEASAQDEKSN